MRIFAIFEYFLELKIISNCFLSNMLEIEKYVHKNK